MSLVSMDVSSLFLLMFHCFFFFCDRYVYRNSQGLYVMQQVIMIVITKTMSTVINTES